MTVLTSAQRHERTEVSLSPPGWGARTAPLKATVLADLHLGSHANDIARFKKIVAEVNVWRPDIVLLLGDFMNSQIFGGGHVPPDVIAGIPHGPNLTLCGHTHVGQVRMPLIGPLINSSRAPLRWTSGHVVEDGRHLFVSRGLGTSGVPLRINCSPEVCFLSIGG